MVKAPSFCLDDRPGLQGAPKKATERTRLDDETSGATMAVIFVKIGDPQNGCFSFGVRLNKRSADSGCAFVPREGGTCSVDFTLLQIGGFPH